MQSFVVNSNDKLDGESQSAQEWGQSPASSPRAAPWEDLAVIETSIIEGSEAGTSVGAHKKVAKVSVWTLVVKGSSANVPAVSNSTQRQESGREWIHIKKRRREFFVPIFIILVHQKPCTIDISSRSICRSSSTPSTCTRPATHHTPPI